MTAISTNSIIGLDNFAFPNGMVGTLDNFAFPNGMVGTYTYM